MSLDSKEGSRLLIFQVFRYVSVGILNNLIYYSIFLFLIKILDVHYSISVLIAFIISIISGYFMNTKFAFRMPSYEKRSFIKYTLLYSSSFIINLSVLFYLIEYNSLEAWVAQIVGSVTVAIYNFIFLKFYVYK